MDGSRPRTRYLAKGNESSTIATVALLGVATHRDDWGTEAGTNAVYCLEPSTIAV